MNSIKSYIKESRTQETEKSLEKLLEEVKSENLLVEFGTIGVRTTYALIHSEDHKIEILGYTYIKDMKYYDETKGRLKALQQAVARKNVNIKN